MIEVGLFAWGRFRASGAAPLLFLGGFISFPSGALPFPFPITDEPLLVAFLHAGNLKAGSGEIERHICQRVPLELWNGIDIDGRRQFLSSFLIECLTD